MKKYALVFLSVFLFISAPFAAHANIVTATGKYLINAVKHVPGAVRVDATNTATGAKHVIKHGISSADLGKGIGAGIVGMAVGSGVGLAFQAITGLALDAVDWVMDPANNSIRYKDDTVQDPENSEYLWQWARSYPANYIYPSAEVAARARCDAIGGTFGGIYQGVPNQYYHFRCIKPDGSIANQSVEAKLNSDYVPVPSQEKSIPLDTLAQKTLELADSGNPAAQKDIEDFVTNLAQSGGLDNELDNATDITEPENPEEPNPDEPQQCPSGTVKLDNVCVKIPDTDGDEPLFCDSSEFTKKVCDWIDWTQEEPEEVTPEQIDIKEVDADNSNKINMSGECPEPYQLSFNVLGYEQNHSISYEPLCGALVLLKPIFVGSGALSGMFILMGYSRASNTGVN